VERIIQLVPGLAPMLNGVGDFSLAIARTLRERFDVATHFAVCSAAWQGPDEVEGFAVSAVRTRDARALASHLDRTCSRENARIALLQLSPYGVDPKGAPFWLSEALGAWKRGSAGRSVVTYFHELFAMSAPWRKGFWLSPFQRRACARMARTSDALMTNRCESAQWLARAAGIREADIEVLPVLSCVGEPGSVAGARIARLVLWGSGAAKSTLYRRHGGLLAALAGRLGIESVVDIGGSSPDMPRAVGRAPVSALGIARAECIGDVLGNSALGVVGYPPALLGKSSIFAAFAAHALPALVLDAGDAPRVLPDGLVRGVHLFTREDADGLSPGSLRPVGQAARDWYAGHDAQRHAVHIAQLVTSLSSRFS